MSEPDHVFLRPLQNLMIGNNPAAFPFFYIDPSRKDYVHITQKFVGADKTRHDCEKIAPIGNSPTFLRFDDLRTVAGPWVNTSIAIFQDKESNKVRLAGVARVWCACARIAACCILHQLLLTLGDVLVHACAYRPRPLTAATFAQEWGWVMEMYAFTIALFNHQIGPVGLHLELASQPPWDTEMDTNGLPYYILHYTYGMDYTLTGEFTPGKFGAWRFDKRSHSAKPPPRNLPPPPLGMKNDLVRALIKAINEASNAIPGWDEYAETGTATQFLKYAP